MVEKLGYGPHPDKNQRSPVNVTNQLRWLSRGLYQDTNINRLDKIRLQN